MTAKKKRKPAIRYTEERAARILAEAAVEGDATVAERWGISRKTLERYRARQRTDAQLSDSVHLKKAALDITWQERAQQTIRYLLGRIDELAAKAGPDQLRDVAGALHIVCSHSVASEALIPSNGRRAEPDRPGPAAPPPASLTSSRPADGASAVH